MLRCSLVEVFASIQGEGPDAGVPALFARLAGCPIRCPWCDTKHSWGPGRVVALEELVGELEGLLRSSKPELLVVTGGEPAAQRSCVDALAAWAWSTGLKPTMETSGWLPAWRGVALLHYTVVSPKRRSGRLWVHSSWFEAPTEVYWKFVVGDASELREVDLFVEEHGLEPSKVYLMPLTTRDGVADQLRLLPLLAEHAIRTGYRVTPRLHLLARVR